MQKKTYIYLSLVFCLMFIFNCSDNNHRKFHSIIATPELIAHRGAAGLAPENTLAAIDSAISYQVPFIEIDVRRTKDGKIILMHDNTVNRTTNGKGKVHKLTWDYIQKLDAGSHFSPKFKNERAPTLTAVMEKIKPVNISLVIEVKNPDRYPGIGDQIIALAKEQNIQNKIILISFNNAFIYDMSIKYPQISTGQLYLFAPRGISEKLKNCDYVSIHKNNAFFFAKRIKRLHEKGYKVWGWTINSDKKMRKILDRNLFDGIVSDFPDKFYTHNKH